MIQPAYMKLLKLPQLKQIYEYDCGATVLQSVLGYFGIEVKPHKIRKHAGTNKNGTLIVGITTTLAKHGLQYTSKQMTIKEVINFLDQQIPVILLLQAWTKKKKIDWKNDWTDGHYVVAIGHDKKKMIFADPWSFTHTFLTFDELEQRWHDKDPRGKKHINWGIAVYGKDPSIKEKLIHMD